jgi:hypothetical protein
LDQSTWDSESLELGTMPTYIKLVGMLLLVLPPLLFAMWRWRLCFVRRRFLATIRMVAQKERSEIGGQPVEYWLNILNQDRTDPIVAICTMTLTYEGQDYYFVDGGISYVLSDKRAYYKMMEAFVLIAIGQSAVRLLAEQERVFRRICGSEDLAAFSVYRWSDFAKMLARENERHIPAA